MQVIKPNEITNSNGSFVDGSFARASTGTYLDFDGVIKTAASGAPRFNYNSDTLLFEGLLVEPARTNLLLQSETFDNASWVKTASTVTANAASAPTGAATADKLLETATSAEHILIQSYAAAANTTYTFSVFVKAAERNFALIQVGNFGNQVASNGVRIDLTTGEFTATDLTRTTVTKYSNGWWRVATTVTSIGSAVTLAPAIYSLTSLAGSATYLGVATSGIFVWGAQFEVGTNATSYISTTTATVARAADTITGTGLIYTDLTDATAVWSSGTTYGATIQVKYLGFIYQSTVAGNLNKQPDISPTFWLKLRPDNLHASLDGSVSTASTKTQSLIQVIKPGKLDSFALINVQAATVDVAVTDQQSGLILYSATFGLSGANIVDWFQYFFFDTISERTQILGSGIDGNFIDSIITVKLNTGVSSTASLGALITGITTTLGQTQMGVQVGIVDYSRKETDEFGTIQFVERPFSKRMSAELYFSNTQLNTVQRYLYSLRAKPAVWIANDDPTYEEALIVYGFYRDFSTTIAYPTHSLCSLEIEGLT